MRRLILAVMVTGAMAVPMTAAAVSVGSPAWASSSVKCAKLSGSATTTATISSCTPKNASYVSASGKASALESGGPITWSPSKKTTDLSKPSFKQVTPDKCPAGDSEYSIKGSVTGGTATYTKKGNSVSALVCVTSTLSFSLLKGTYMYL
jgi:hypothetical protein